METDEVARHNSRITVVKGKKVKREANIYALLFDRPHSEKARKAKTTSHKRNVEGGSNQHCAGNSNEEEFPEIRNHSVSQESVFSRTCYLFAVDLRSFLGGPLHIKSLRMLRLVRGQQAIEGSFLGALLHMNSMGMLMLVRGGDMRSRLCAIHARLHFFVSWRVRAGTITG
ncbi:hypothetical protein POM88_002610 [Heracleum sosnowskyi]|uniref:Uncharacterized protein n=1 Tax=Heracleum sosnowskyi TaxID=360622 RepID=A0AAD8N626_9APIA|nr:hypothetical protein POM88_002610 [Heracleum sosnowskyi]